MRKKYQPEETSRARSTSSRTRAASAPARCLIRLFVFLELFAGQAGLTTRVAEVARGWATTRRPEDVWTDGWDICDDKNFEKLCKESDATDWIHKAPPCGTFTRARRSDEFGTVDVLRSDSHPEGWGDPRAEQGNQIARKVAALCRQRHNKGQWWSIENPKDSYLWELKEFQQLKKLPGVYFVIMDQCAYGASSRKPTGILTNAPWMLLVNKTCGQARWHNHTVLKGKALDYRCDPPLVVWRSSLAAEYPTGLCLAWAKALLAWIKVAWAPRMTQQQLVKVEGKPNVLMLKTKIEKFENLLMKKVKPKDAMDWASKRKIREEENRKAVGGLRNPTKAVAKNPQLIRTGRRIRDCLEKALTDNEAMKVMESLGKEDGGFRTATVREARRLLRKEMGIPDNELGGYQWDLFEACLKAAQDPETAVPRWLKEGVPLGIENEIEPCGIFPETPEDSRAVEASKVFTKMMALQGANPDWHNNYNSFYEAEDLAEKDVERIFNEGKAERFKTWEEVVQFTGKEPWLTKMACVLKTKADTTTKVRLVVDMFRSGVNGLMRVPQRIVLPRIADICESGVDLLEEWLFLQEESPYKDIVLKPNKKFQEIELKPNKEFQEIELKPNKEFQDSKKQEPEPEWTPRSHNIPEPEPEPSVLEFCVIDFKDAFYTLHTKANEQKYTIIGVAKWWLVFLRLCFGLACAPLIWGRVAAAASRLGQAMFNSWELRIQVYVDDPAIAVAGNTRQERARRVALLLLLWTVLGMDISWSKGQFGPSVQWIGAQITAQPKSVEVELTEDKEKMLSAAFQEYHQKKGMIKFSDANSLAGRLAWVGSIIPKARPFVAHFWAALSDARQQGAPKKASTRSRPKELMFKRRTDHAVLWLETMLQQKGRLKKTFKVAHRSKIGTCRLRVDACPFGMGGILMDKQGEPVAYWADVISEKDLKRCKATRGDPAFQAEWELLSILVSLHIFGKDLEEDAGVTIESDSVAALCAALELKGRSPLMNALASEVMLRLEEYNLEAVVAKHIPGVMNFLADALSRLSAGKELPESLAKVRRVPSPVRDEKFWRAWPADWV